jgi:hypothetical protein
VTPNQFCDAIPAANADLCTRLTRFFNIANLLCDFFSYFLNSDGSISDTVITTTNVGNGWLLCNGAAVSRTTYANLFAAIGTRYGAGDGTLTFNIPDGRSRSLLAAGQGGGGSLSNRDINTINVGEETHAMTEAELVAHTHLVKTFSAGATGGDGGDILNEPDAGVIRYHPTESTGGSTPFNVMHPCLIAYLFIKT